MAVFQRFAESMIKDTQEKVQVCFSHYSMHPETSSEQCMPPLAVLTALFLSKSMMSLCRRTATAKTEVQILAAGGHVEELTAEVESPLLTPLNPKRDKKRHPLY